MKKFILSTLLLFSIHIFINAQNNYDRLLDTNKVWNFTGCYGPPPYYTTFYKFKADSIIGGLQYYKFLYSSDSVVWHNWYGNTLLREDTILKRVYILSNNIEGLLYDFGLVAGDSVVVINTACFGDSATLHLLSVDSILLNNQTYRKRFHFNYDEWTEGIGSFAGLVRPGCFTVGNCDELVCYYENGNFQYLNPNYTQCFNSQPNDYFRYVDTNNLWNYTDINGGSPPYYSTLFRFKKDTLINGIPYFTAESTIDSVNWEQWTYYFRQEGKKVFVWHGSTESLVYDFNAMPGDTLQIFHDNLGTSCTDTCKIKIMGIVLINIDGLYRKQTGFQYLNCPGTSDYWIEGIGFEYDILKKCIGLVGPPTNRLVCFYENGVLKYTNPAYGSCFTLFVNTAEKENKPEEKIIFKNNGNGIYAFQAQSQIEKIITYDITGKKMKTYIPHSDETEINLSFLPKGFYLCSIQTKWKKYVYKIVKE